MAEHIFLPSVKPDEIILLPEHEAWLASALHDLEKDIEHADIAASMCLQGAISELAIYSRIKTDWIGVMDEYCIFQGG